MVVVVVVPIYLICLHVRAGTTSCSFPFTYEGELHYSCIDDIENVSPDDDTSACLADNATAILCDIASGS